LKIIFSRPPKINDSDIAKQHSEYLHVLRFWNGQEQGKEYGLEKLMVWETAEQALEQA
jgi:hypothetical protein